MARHYRSSTEVACQNLTLMIHRPGPSTPRHGRTIGRGFQLRRVTIPHGPFLISVHQLPTLIKSTFGMSKKIMLVIGEPIVSTFSTPPPQQSLPPQLAELSPPIILQAVDGPKSTGLFHSPKALEMAIADNHLTFQQRVGPATSAFSLSATTVAFAWDSARSLLPRRFLLGPLPSLRSLQQQSPSQVLLFGETLLT